MRYPSNLNEYSGQSSFLIETCVYDKDCGIVCFKAPMLQKLDILDFLDVLLDYLCVTGRARHIGCHDCHASLDIRPCNVVLVMYSQ